MQFYYHDKIIRYFGFGLKWQNWNTGLTIQIQNPILTLDCQSQSNPPNWIAIRIEQSSNPIQQYPGSKLLLLRVGQTLSKLPKRISM